MRRSMHQVIRLAATFVLLTGTPVAPAAVSPQEAAELGKSLTRYGAIHAGNKDGTIPAYSGGLNTPPPGYKAGSGHYVDPFKGEKPLYSITAANMAQYADKLPEGQKHLLRKYPDYRLDVYPTHRSSAPPAYHLDKTVENATRAELSDGGIGIKNVVAGGIPFPIPKNGHEAMWNVALTYQAPVREFRTKAYYNDQSGRTVMTGDGLLHAESPYHDPDMPEAERNFIFRAEAISYAPSAAAGQRVMVMDPVDASNKDRVAYLYIPAQRRAKLAPELAYDTPNPTSAGAVTMDDSVIFLGKLDRYNFKLVGKKEMLIPYNNYRFHGEKDIAKLTKPHFINPDYLRWERHRVWVVEAELLPGKRHVYKKRVFYWDEDTWHMGMSDEYDMAGKLFRHGISVPMQMYDANHPWSESFTHYDFSSNIYVMSVLLLGEPYKIAGVRKYSSRQWAPAAMEGRGVR